MHVRNLVPATAVLLALTGCGVANASTAAPGLRATAGPSGWVIEQQPGTVTVAPFDRKAAAVTVTVTAAQAVACVRLTVYRDGVCRTEVTTGTE